MEVVGWVEIVENHLFGIFFSFLFYSFFRLTCDYHVDSLRISFFILILNYGWFYINFRAVYASPLTEIPSGLFTLLFLLFEPISNYGPCLCVIRFGSSGIGGRNPPLPTWAVADF